jgi:hypothetical protein
MRQFLTMHTLLDSEILLPEKNLGCGVPITSTPSNDIDFDFESFFSFDTVIFSTFLEKDDRYELDTIFKPLSKHFFYRAGIDGKFKLSEFSKFEILPEKEFWEMKSYKKGINFCVSESGEISFQLSVPKLYYGTNLFLFYDIEKFFCDFHFFLSHYLPGLSDWQTWVIKRIDWCCNFDVGDQIDDLLSYLSKCEFRGRQSLRKGGKEYPYFNWRGRTLKFYDKYKEMEKNKQHHDMTHHDLASGVLRIEEEWKQENLKHKLFVDSVKDCTVHRFLQYLKRFSFTEKLESIFKNILFKKKEDIDLTVPEIEKRVFDFYESSGSRGWAKFASKTIRFYHQALDCTRDELYQKYGKHIVYRREKFFRDIGIPLRWNVQRNIKDFLFDYSLFSFDKICYFKQQYETQPLLRP